MPHDPLDWCLPSCACGGRDRGTMCALMPGCANCLEIVGVMGHVIGTMGSLLLVHLHPGETAQSAIRRMLEADEKPPRYMN